MKTNTSVLPKLLFLNPRLAYKMARGFFKMGLAKLKKKRSYGYDHMKDFCLIYMKLTPLCNLHCVMCGQRGDKGVLKGEFAANESKSIVPLNTYKKIVDELASKNPVYYLWGGEPFLYPD